MRPVSAVSWASSRIVALPCLVQFWDRFASLLHLNFRINAQSLGYFDLALCIAIGRRIGRPLLCGIQYVFNAAVIVVEDLVQNIVSCETFRHG
jgi:hypothetical protein